MNYKIPVTPCLSCGKSNDACSTMLEQRAPKPRDITVCLYCGHIMAFADDLTLRALTDEEMYAVAGHPDVLMVQEMRSHFLERITAAKEAEEQRNETQPRT